MQAFFNNSKKAMFFIIVYFFIAFTASAQLVFDKNQFQVDENLHLIVCNRIPDKVSTGFNLFTFDKFYTLSTPINAIKVGFPYKISSNGITYTLYFTRVPIVNLQVVKDIQDNYNGGLISISDTIDEAISSNMGIKLRGALSRTYPKKSYHIQLWADSTGNTTQNKSIFGMRDDQTWLLLAMYNEKLRLNNKISHELWLKLHKLYYSDQEPDAYSTIHTRYVEVFLNNNYQGIYLFTEDTDRKQLQLKKQTSSNSGGELYKGYDWDQGTLFTGLLNLPNSSAETWSGWEVDYPDTTNWINLHQFTDFVVNSSDSLFKQQIATKIRQDNFADYFIFLNLIRAEDNTGKNLFLARYNKNEPYFIAPWDLDGTWGYYWDGSTRNITDDIVSNHFFDRLLNLTDTFKIQAATRWFSLRHTILSMDSLRNSINNYYNFLSMNGVYEREALKWAGPLLSYSNEEVDYIQNWTQERINYLDGYFKILAQNKPIIYNFKASALERSAMLEWSANCIAISSFDIERSTDSLAWNTISIYSIISNDSLPCQYTFTDSKPGEGNFYYRLKISDKQNNSLYSPIQSLNFSLLETPVNIFPNPATTTLQVQGTIDKVDLYSTRGNFISESDSSSPNMISVNTLPTGTYMVRITQKNGTVSTYKILVNRE